MKVDKKELAKLILKYIEFTGFPNTDMSRKEFAVRLSHEIVEYERRKINVLG